MSCGKQMKWNISIEFHLPFFLLPLAVQICFCLPFLKYDLLLAIGSPLFRALVWYTQNIRNLSTRSHASQEIALEIAGDFYCAIFSFWRMWRSRPGLNFNTQTIASHAIHNGGKMRFQAAFLNIVFGYFWSQWYKKGIILQLKAWGRLYKTLCHFFNHYFVVK
jgi:hypothetical protein